MQKPNLNPLPFAINGQKNVIPDVASGGSASFSQGFPTLTMTPMSQGGIPPSGQDFNGILNHLDEHIVWQSAGMGYQFNADFANKIEGYAKGAVIRSYDGLTAYVSTADGNKTDPESNGQNWIVFAGRKFEPIKLGGIIFNVNYVTPDEVHAGEGYGTWERFAEGRVLIGTGTGTDKNSITMTFANGQTEGEYSHTLTVAEMPKHNHGSNMRFEAGEEILVDAELATKVDSGDMLDHMNEDTTASTNTTYSGNNQPHNNLQPFVAVGIWKRIA